MGVVSNCSFGSEVIRYEPERHALAEHLQFVMISAEYAIRKPNLPSFTTATARLGLAPEEIWFVGDRLSLSLTESSATSSTWILGLCQKKPSVPGAFLYYVQVRRLQLATTRADRIVKHSLK